MIGMFVNISFLENASRRSLFRALVSIKLFLTFCGSCLADSQNPYVSSIFKFLKKPTNAMQRDFRSKSEFNAALSLENCWEDYEMKDINNDEETL